MAYCRTQSRQRKTFKVFSPSIKLFLKEPASSVTNSCISLIDAAGDVTDLAERLKNADKKKKALQKDLLDAQNQLNGIKRGRTSQGIMGLARLFNWLCLSLFPEFIHYSSSFPLITHFFKSDDISNMIDEAKRKAASANDTASDTMDKLNTIRNEIDNLSVTPGDSNLGGLLDDVDKSGEILKRHL